MTQDNFVTIIFVTNLQIIHFMKTLFVVVLALCSLGAIGQSANTGKKPGGNSTGKTVQPSNTEHPDWQNFLATHMCIIHDVDAEKALGYTEITLENPGNIDLNSLTTETFNPLQFNITPLPNEQQYLHIAGTSKVIFVYSKARLDVLFERYLTNKANQ